MPNWCDTVLTVRGNETNLDRFIAGINIADDGDWEILESYYPVPEALRITSTITFEAIPEQWLDGVREGTWTQEEFEERVKKNFELRQAQLDNYAKYGSTDWYHWCNDNWGTKWGDCDTRLINTSQGVREFHLRSAWGPITLGLLKVSKDHPQLTFILANDEEAGFFLEVVVVRNGEVLFQMGCVPCEDHPWPANLKTDDEYDLAYETHEEWKHDRIQEFMAEANDFLSTTQ